MLNKKDGVGEEPPLGCIGCCVCPQGRLAIAIPFALAVIGYMFLSISTLSCNFMKIDGYLSNEEPFVVERSETQFQSNIGLFSFQNFLEFGGAGAKHICEPYTRQQIKEYMGSAFRVSRMFAVLSHMFLFVATLTIAIGSCAFLHQMIWKICGWMFIVGSVWEVLIFVVFDSEPLTGDLHNGRSNWGVILLVMSCFLNVAAGILTLRIPPFDPENIPESAVDAIRDQPFLKNILPQAKEEKKFRMPAGSETVKEEIMADGSRKYITTNWHKDGTTTVTEEIQQE